VSAAPHESGEREWAFVRATLGRFVRGEPPSGVPDGLDWAALDRLLARHFLYPLFAHLHGRDPAVPADPAAAWCEGLAVALLRYERAVRAAVHMGGLLEMEGIPAVVLRGLAVAHTLYPDPCLRPMADVDLLVPASARGALPERLRRHGLAPTATYRHQFVYELNGVRFEVHWLLLTPERYGHVPPLAQWFERRQPLRIAAGTLHVLPPEEEMLGQLVHAYVHHGLENLYGLLDVGLAARRPDLDWARIAEWCRRAAVSRMARFALTYVDRLLDLGLEDRLRAIGPSPTARGVTAFTAHDACLRGEDRLARFFVRRGNMVALAERPWTRILEVLRHLRPQEWIVMARIAREVRTRGRAI
jgi:hypothetical protein